MKKTLEQLIEKYQKRREYYSSEWMMKYIDDIDCFLEDLKSIEQEKPVVDIEALMNNFSQDTAYSKLAIYWILQKHLTPSVKQESEVEIKYDKSWNWDCECWCACYKTNNYCHWCWKKIKRVE